MRSALDGHPDAARLWIDFYDRTRLATWVNQYPGVAAWVRSKIGGPAAGWRPIGDWKDALVAEDRGYLVDDRACLIDESTQGKEILSIPDGIARMRTRLGIARQCIRLIGMSGLGKTRLVQALFEPEVGEAPLDPALSIYTDYSDDTLPPARELARRLVDEGARAILIVDNCTPAIHGELAVICSGVTSDLSLLTVEYDVRDDEPESTDVFRLTGVSENLVEQWLEREFNHISQVDRGRIASFSEGNFRVARSLAETLRRGETLGQLRNQDLFARLFHQRHDRDQQLLHDAQLLALVYSYDGEDVGDAGELAKLGRAFGRSPDALYASTTTLQQRGIVQTRGFWRAVLPHAIANPLAAGGLERIAPATLDAFAFALPARLLKSFTRRLSFLHDCLPARRAIERWLKSDGLFDTWLRAGEEGFALIDNVAPVAPELVLELLEQRLDSPQGSEFLSLQNRDRWRWGRLLKLLAYDPSLFERAAMALARFAGLEPKDYNNNPAARPFRELFHIFLSGTQALPSQRLTLLKRLLDAEDATLRRAGEMALEAMLKTGLFSLLSNVDFGARPRDFGWRPRANEEASEWFNQAIALVEEYGPSNAQVRDGFAGRLRGLWHIAACRDAIERLAFSLSAHSGWLGGWTAFRGAYRFDRDGMDTETVTRLEVIIEHLAPDNLLDRARAYLLTNRAGGWDVVDGDGDGASAYRRAEDAALEIGKAMATEPELLDVLLPEIFAAERTMRIISFARGLAQGAEALEPLWDRIVDAYRSQTPPASGADLLAGFIGAAHKRDPSFAAPHLESALSDQQLLPHLPHLQAHVALDIHGLGRMIRVAAVPGIKPWCFNVLRSGFVEQCPAEPLAELLIAISQLEGGSEVALDILQMRIYCAEENPDLLTPPIIACGRSLLLGLPFSDSGALQDYWLDSILVLCMSGKTNADDARVLAERIYAGLNAYNLHWHDAEKLVVGLFKAQPEMALNLFVLRAVSDGSPIVWEVGIERKSPLEEIDYDALVDWAERDPGTRYPMIGGGLPMFASEEGDTETGLSPRFTEMLKRAPDRRAYLAAGAHRFQPSGWVGSLANRLEERLGLLEGIRSVGDPAIDEWIDEITPQIAARAERERQRETREEERFE